MKNLLVFCLVFYSFFSFGQKGFSYSAVVIDSLPLKGIQVELYPNNLIIFTDNKGNFSFENLEKGVYKLNFVSENHIPLSKNIVISSSSIGDTFRLTFLANTNLKSVTIKRKMNRNRTELKIQNSTSIVHINKKEELDNLPNKNAADLAQRLPGVSLFRSKGESNMVSMRGTPVDWTSVLVEGDRLPVACEDNPTRSFEFEAFPSIFVDEVIEAKGITPDLESDNIGGTLNFMFPRCSDKKVVQLEMALGQNFYAKLPYGNANFLVSNTSKSKKFSYLISGTYFGRAYTTQTRKTLFGSNFNHGINRLELRNNYGFRGTAGVHGALVYKPSNKIDFTLRAFIGNMLDEKNMDKVSFNWYEDNLRRIRLQNAKGKLIRQIEGVTLESNVHLNDKLSAVFRISSYSNQFRPGRLPFSSNDTRNGFLICDFMSPEINFTDFEKVDFYGNAIDQNATDFSLLKLIGSDNPYGNGGDPELVAPTFTEQLTPSQFEFTQAYTEINRIGEKDPIVFQNDWEYKLNKKLLFQAGVKYRYKKGQRTLSKHDWFRDYSNGISTPILLSDFNLTSFMNTNKAFFQNAAGNTYSGYNYSFLTDKVVGSFLENYRDSLREVTMNPQNFEYNQWVGSSYKYQEHQSSGFAMFSYAHKKIALLGGVRVEHTYLIETSDTLTTQIAFDSTSNTYYYVPKSITIYKPYIGILPSLHFNWFINSKSNLKIGLSETMHRPNFEETKPGHAVIRYNDLDFTFGNPNLKPVFSRNIDIDYERYFSENGMFAIGGYFKSIKDHIYALSTPNTDPISGATMRYYGNASNSWLGGIELFLCSKFGFIHPKLKNWGFRLNASYSDSRMKIVGRSTNQRMTKQMPFLGSLNLFYESDAFEFNANLSYTSRYLNEINLVYLNGDLLHKNDDFDTYMNQFINLESSFLVKLKKGIKIKAELGNLLNYPETKSRGKNWRTLNKEYFGLRGEFAVIFEL